MCVCVCVCVCVYHVCPHTYSLSHTHTYIHTMSTGAPPMVKVTICAGPNPAGTVHVTCMKHEISIKLHRGHVSCQAEYTANVHVIYM